MSEGMYLGGFQTDCMTEMAPNKSDNTADEPTPRSSSGNTKVSKSKRRKDIGATLEPGNSRNPKTYLQKCWEREGQSSAY
jgi:hypothetical protein